MVLFTDNIPSKAKYYICLVIVFGSAVLAYSLHESFTSNRLTWIFLAALTAVASFVPVGIPYAKGTKGQSITVTASDVFIFAAIPLYSPEVAVCVAMIDGCLASLKIKRYYRIAFNLSQVSLVTFLSAHLFYKLQGQNPPLAASGSSDALPLLFNLGLCACLYFVLNSGSIALAISLVTHNRVLEIWKQNLLWAWVKTFAGGLAAGVVVLNFERMQFLSFGIAVPLIIVIYHASRMNHQRILMLQESQRFQATLDALSSHIALLDDYGAIIAVNAAWRNFAEANQLSPAAYGVGANYLQTLEIPSSHWVKESPALVAGFREVMTKDRDEFYMECPLPSIEEKRWFAVRATRFQGDGPSRVVVAQEDITQRKQAEEALSRSEEQLRQSQKIEAIGGLAGGIAHDFNNLLTVILGYGEMLSTKMRKDDPSRVAVAEIMKAANRAATLTRQLLAFSRKQMLQPKVIDLNNIVSDVQKMLQRVIGEDIELVMVPGKELGRVKADPGQVEQVIMNLAVNARDAMPEGGTLTIETENVELDDTYDQMATGLKPGPYVILSVSDTGCGMDAETLSRVFEPFFTTKEVGKGTGLGLATVYGIVKQSGGQIFVYSEPGIGTTFKIYLPQVEGVVESVEQKAPTAVAPLGSETVLLVEDEDMVRQLARKMLERKGYSVLEACHGGEALLLSEVYKGHIHLMMTDVVMPHMKGYELAARLLPSRPEMKVLYISGYTGNGITRNGILKPDTAFLPKPFTLNSLAHKVREVLDI